MNSKKIYKFGEDVVDLRDEMTIKLEIIFTKLKYKQCCL